MRVLLMSQERLSSEVKNIGLIRFRRLVRSQSYGLVANQTSLLVNFDRGNDLAFEVVFGPGNKECASLVKKGIETMEINVSLVHHVI